MVVLIFVSFPLTSMRKVRRTETDGLVLHGEMEDKPGPVSSRTSLPKDDQKPADGFYCGVFKP